MNESHRIIKKQVAALAGVSPRTMNRHRDKYAFLDRCRCPGTGRPTFNRGLVVQEMRRRRMMP